MFWRGLKIATIAWLCSVSWAGCTELQCGTGTHREGDYCVPNIPSVCGEGTVYELGWCVVADTVDTGDVTSSDAGNAGTDDARDADAERDGG